jgi:uncharacterized surface protein with fasciclin (FAS1) repeats
MKNSLATMTMLSLLGGMLAPAHADNSSVEKSLADDGDLSMFQRALRNTGVANELNEDTKYTIFAPNNAAFAEILPGSYPCFYSTQCRGEVAAVLRNHIVPRNGSIEDLSKWGGDIPTLGTRRLYVEESYKDQYTVEGHTVLHQSLSDGANVYPVDGVIISDRELGQFHTQPVAENGGAVTEKTVTTTYRAPFVTPVVSGRYNMVPGGNYPAVLPVYLDPDDSLDDSKTTTTVTHTTTTQ